MLLSSIPYQTWRSRSWRARGVQPCTERCALCRPAQNRFAKWRSCMLLQPWHRETLPRRRADGTACRCPRTYLHASRLLQVASNPRPSSRCRLRSPTRQKPRTERAHRSRSEEWRRCYSGCPHRRGIRNTKRLNFNIINNNIYIFIWISSYATVPCHKTNCSSVVCFISSMKCISRIR